MVWLSNFEVWMAVENRQRHKSQASNQIQENLFQHEIEQFILRPIILFILYGIRYNSLISGKSQSLYLFTRRVIKHTVVITDSCHSY